MEIIKSSNIMLRKIHIRKKNTYNEILTSYPLKSLGVTVEKVSEWHARFSEVLQDLLLSEKKKSISSEVKRYVALFVYIIIFSASDHQRCLVLLLVV